MATKILHQERFNVVRQHEASFDRACESAWRMYRKIYLRMDEDGRAREVEGFERMGDEIVVEFIGYASRGREHVYDFWGRVERHEEDLTP